MLRWWGQVTARDDGPECQQCKGTFVEHVEAEDEPERFIASSSSSRHGASVQGISGLNPLFAFFLVLFSLIFC